MWALVCARARCSERVLTNAVRWHSRAGLCAAVSSVLTVHTALVSRWVTLAELLEGV